MRRDVQAEVGATARRVVRRPGRGAGRAPETVAAVDLGSNSFHMIVARLSHGQLHVVDRLRERVAMGEGLGADRRLSGEAAGRALACLERFGQRLRDLPRGSVRAVGTNTLRRMKDAGAFKARAERALGHPIEIVSGTEEARLIYLGVAHSTAEGAGRRLVVDIGGGSTECILGEGFEISQVDSLDMGCIHYSRQYFKDGRITAAALDRATIAALLELRSIRRRVRTLGFQRCLGASGTITSIEAILRANGWSEGGVTRKGLKRLRRALLDAGSVADLRLAGMAAERAPVLPGGFAILVAVVESFAVERMDSSSGALREGVLYDLLGRIQREDVRDRTIRTFSERYHIDVEQAARVERTALAALEQVAGAWDLDDDESRRMLAWAARLHEIGMSIAYGGYHKHGAYIVANADMAGFSHEDQALLALLLRCHRGRLTRDEYDAAPPSRAMRAVRLSVLLRLAVRLNRSRSPRVLPAFRLRADASSLRLAFPAGWLVQHPLTRADLDVEADSLAALGPRGVKLAVR